MYEQYDEVNDYFHLQIQGDIINNGKPVRISQATFKHDGKVLSYLQHSDKWDMIPTKSVPIGILMGGGQDQVILKDEDDNMYEAYVYNYTKHETGERQYILDDIRSKSN